MIRGALNVVGLSLLNRIATYNNTSPDLTTVNNATTHSIINYYYLLFLQDYFLVVT